MPEYFFAYYCPGCQKAKGFTGKRIAKAWREQHLKKHNGNVYIDKEPNILRYEDYPGIDIANLKGSRDE